MTGRNYNNSKNLVTARWTWPTCSMRRWVFVASSVSLGMLVADGAIFGSDKPSARSASATVQITAAPPITFHSKAAITDRPLQATPSNTPRLSRVGGSPAAPDRPAARASEKVRPTVNRESSSVRTTIVAGEKAEAATDLTQRAAEFGQRIRERFAATIPATKLVGTDWADATELASKPSEPATESNLTTIDAAQNPVTAVPSDLTTDQKVADAIQHAPLSDTAHDSAPKRLAGWESYIPATSPVLEKRAAEFRTFLTRHESPAPAAPAKSANETPAVSSPGIQPNEVAPARTTHRDVSPSSGTPAAAPSAQLLAPSSAIPMPPAGHTAATLREPPTLLSTSIAAAAPSDRPESNPLAHSEVHSSHKRSWELEIDGTQRICLSRNVASVEVSNQKVCEILQVGSREVVVVGKASGTSTVRLSFDTGAPDQLHAFRVSRHAEEIAPTEETLAQFQAVLVRKFPGRSIELQWSRESLVVKGTAADRQEAIQILAFVRNMYLVPVVDRLDVPRGKPSGSR